MAGKHLVVIGGGAAGFFCAVNAARINPELKVTIVEKSSKLLSKVKVSGGGRCNVTHACFEISEMVKRYPRGGNFVKKTFHQFFTTDTIQWFKERGVELKAENDGRMFPVTDSSQTIIECLLKEANRYRIEILMNKEVRSIRKEDTGFILTTGNEHQLAADYVCIACGGYPKTGMFDWLRELGHTISDPVPSLFTFNMPGNPITQLMGLSVEKARVKINGSKLEQEGPLLITHWGMSGPGILKLSAWGARELAALNWQFSVSINWVPDYNENTLRERLQEIRFGMAAQKIGNKNPFGLPGRLWEFMLEQAGANKDMRWADFPAKAQNQLIRLMVTGAFEVKGKTTFKEEFVTAGGVNLSEIDPSTMMSKKIGGLFFAGEIADVDGVTGGFNFQNAWTSGYIAAAAIGNQS
ncbi:NAD(P)/FAD-dependent oxidoreductase [Terrimonas sp. NA20]|uniref:NAD(P)/FAD-dependent oxidoreductase n=1 Tax=Terrimonas ginsenosidimutans TaxID=2908004 RepID=A0ABS9KRH4_9BACT|nr:NAD(P)/FAD-dependent oxidoreductase [Terrimonas ginsenosidimutans]MCG2614926.1 NAD(P)/FAD-dependent oxidoreductase [Terrimonas ginsenosidimutans]